MALYPFVLLHYSIMLICTLAVSGGTTAPMELDCPSKKGNLKAPPTPLTPPQHMSGCHAHAQVDANIIMQGSVETHLRQGRVLASGEPGEGGGVGVDGAPSLSSARVGC